MKLTSCVFIFLLFSVTIHAQEQQRALSSTIGYLVKHEGLGTAYTSFSPGVHLGFNLYGRNAKRFKTDLQLSINLSGRNGTGSYLSVNALYGGRYYFIAPEEPVTIFTNVLIGGALINETGDDFTETLLGFGYSVGYFVGVNRLVVGVTAESYHSFILKVGYVL